MKRPRTRTIVILSALATTAAIAVGGGATAQQRHNSNAPIDFAAQNIELQDRANRAILSGGVKITQSNMTLDANRVTVAYTGAVLGLGYLPQETSIFRGLTVAQNIGAVLEMAEPDKAARAAKLEQLLDEFGLTRLRDSAAMALSGGERRRCEIARALAADPSIVLLDEPFAGIDPLSIADIRDLVKQLKTRGIGVLITDHNVRETLEIVDRACIIYSGQVLFAGSPTELVAHPDVRRLYLGENFQL